MIAEIYFADGANCDSCGGKARGLSRLKHLSGSAGARFQVPPFFVIAAGEVSVAKLQGALTTIKAESGCRSFAVRSSCIEEDGPTNSFAGQFTSYLFVEESQVDVHVEKVRHSVKNKSIETYRKLKGLDGSGPVAVLVQAMVDASVSGVMFSLDPVTQKACPVISMVEGTGDKLMTGTVSGETLYIAGSAPAPGSARPTYLTEAMLAQLLRALGVIEKHFGRPMDVEWCFDREGRLFILQARPITTVDPQSTVFDASNIQESYPGKTSPLTFSFARKCYTEVYKSFVLLMGVKPSVVESRGDLFEYMIGYHEGRIYYNLGNWHRLIQLLPLYKSNKGFMEQMMGLKEPLPQERQAAPSNFFGKLGGLFCLAKILFAALTLPLLKRSFEKRLNLALNIDRQAVKNLSLTELASLYLSLESRLISRWDAPVVNDFFAMIAYGALRKSLSGNQKRMACLPFYLKCKSAVVSGQPPLLLKELAGLISGDRELIRLMESGKTGAARLRLKQHPEAERLYCLYLEKFADRSLGELKLESACLEDDPSVLFSTLAALAGAEKRGVVETLPPQALEPLPWPLALLASLTSSLLAGRENLRFARTRVFGLVRLIFKTMGKRLADSGHIEQPQDIYFLTVDEILGFVGGTAVSLNLAGLVSLRKREYEGASESPLRVTFSGAYGDRKELPRAVPEEAVKALPHTSVLVGQAASAGICRGRVRVIRNPESEALQQGEILVAERTDPGWIVHFSLAAGLVVSHGSLLSHTAIVARELSLPCVVAVENATTRLKTGDLVEVDGRNGKVTILEEAVTDLFACA